MHILLYQPEIPPNTGNIARLCAATRIGLHLIEPLGFRLEDRYLKRAGLDYWPLVDMHVWPNLEAYIAAWPQRRLVMTSAKGHGAAVHTFPFDREDTLVFGRETSGLPEDVLALSPHRVRIPFAPEVRREENVQCVRSLNLSTAAGIVAYFALARCGQLDAWTSSVSPTA